MRPWLVAVLALVVTLPSGSPTPASDPADPWAWAFERPDVYHVDHAGRIAADVRFDHRVPSDMAALVAEAGGLVSFRYEQIPALGIWAPRAVMENLLERLDVLRVEPVPRMRPMQQAGPDPAAPSPGPVEVAAGAMGRGCGAVVAVLDTGADDEHESLRGSYLAGADLSGTNVLALAPPLHERNPDDDNIAAAFRSMNPDPLTTAARFTDDVEAWGYGFDDWADQAWANPTSVASDDWGPRDDLAAWQEELVPQAAGLPQWSVNALVFGNPSHGTHVSSIALGRGSPAGKNVGVAPCAKLVDVKVLTGAAVDLPWSRDHLGSSPFGVAAGLEWVLAYNAGRTSYGLPRQDRVDVISISVSSMCDSARDTTLEELVNVVVEAGVVVVAAAGNCGGMGVKSPGAAALAITVGAVDDRGTATRSDDAPAVFSAFGGVPNKPDLAGPGVNVMSARGLVASPLYHAPVVGPILADQILPTLAADEAFLDDPWGEGHVLPYSLVRTSGYHSLSGTSMSTPHVAGLAAILFAQSPGMSPADVRAALTGAAVQPGGASGWDPVLGWGVLNAADGLPSGGSSGRKPDLGLVRPVSVRRALDLATSGGAAGCAPGEGNQLQVYAWSPDGTPTLRISVDGAPFSTVPLANNVYEQAWDGAPHNVRLEAAMGSHVQRASYDTVACTSVGAAALERTTADDAFLFYATPGAVAGVTSPDGRFLYAIYAGTDPDGVVATLRFDGTITARAAVPGTVAPGAFILVSGDLYTGLARLGGDLVGASADGTWILQGATQGAVPLPAGFQARIQGRVFDNVADGTECFGTRPIASQDIEGDGTGQIPGNLAAAVLVWNWHQQTAPRFDTRCTDAIGFPPEATPIPENLRFFPRPQEALP